MNLGLGTAAIGRPHYINIRPQKAGKPFDKNNFIKEGIEKLSFAYQNGIRHFDTAPGYGIAEEIILKWIKLKNPTGITVSTKWGYTYVANFDLNAPKHEIKEHSLSKLNEQWETSQQLLPYLNIYQIHSATFDSGVLTNKEIHNRLMEIKTKYGLEIGLSASGENQNEIIEMALGVKVNGKELFDSFQVTYNLFDQSLIEIIKKLSNKKLIIKEALANGRVFPNENYPNYSKAYILLKELALKYEVGIDAIAIKFIMQTISLYSVLSGASENEQLKANLLCDNFSLSSLEIKALKELSVLPSHYWKERQKLQWN